MTASLVSLSLPLSLLSLPSSLSLSSLSHFIGWFQHVTFFMNARNRSAYKSASTHELQIIDDVRIKEMIKKKERERETVQKTVKDGGKSNDLDHDGNVPRMHNYFM